ncbi:T cell receptor delta chain [Platysternon megacephalum]|nr:T cell receptor delta chain [Platysternon megacephalum]
MLPHGCPAFHSPAPALRLGTETSPPPPVRPLRGNAETVGASEKDSFITKKGRATSSPTQGILPEESHWQSCTCHRRWHVGVTAGSCDRPETWALPTETRRRVKV